MSLKNLKLSVFCPRPFDTLLIDRLGMVYACECSSWLPKPVGNLQLQSIEQILEGERLRRIQGSILDGSYRHCEEKLCSYLQDTRPSVKLWSQDPPPAELKIIRLGIDDSCNLSCPSCRNRVIYEGRGMRLRKRMTYADAVLRYLETPNTRTLVHIGSDGDPFASLVYRHFMRKFSENFLDHPHHKLGLQTNGLLCKNYMEKNPHLAKKIKYIGLSIDGCTTNTYESLRKGGKFSTLLKNLEFIKQLHDQHKFELQYHCVIQKTNYREMEDYIRFAEAHGADKIWFNRIMDWKTLHDFSGEDVADPRHPDHGDFRKRLDEIRPHALKDGKKFVEFPTLDN